MKKNFNRIGSGALLALLVFLAASPARLHAQEATTTPQTTETATSSALTIEEEIDVPAECEVTDTVGIVHAYPEDSSSGAYLAICALAAAQSDGALSDIGFSNEFPAFGLFVTSINDVVADPSSQYWALYVNDEFASAGVTQLPIVAGDTLTLELHDFSDNPLGSQVTLHIHSLTATPTPSQESATIALRDGDTLIGPFTVTLPATTTLAVPLTPTGGGTTHEVPARSVLALLSALDATSTKFAITDLAYFDSFSSFIVNCIDIPVATSTPRCFSWTYAVDGSFPFVGMDAYELQDGDVAYIIFGSQWRVTSGKSSAAANESFTVTAEEYDPNSGLYEPAESVGVGAVQFDENFFATEFATSTTDSSGQATLSLAAEGAYSVGLTSTGYFPNVPVTITAATGTPPENTGGGGSGGGGGSHVNTFDVPAALAYLVDQQEGDGSFDSEFLSDWAALAFAAADGGAAEDLLRDYLLGATPELSSVTDYERHAMALLALRINPYDDTNVNYIEPIVEAFDGEQIGDADLDNDDIFALFPLLSAGYDSDDTIISRATEFIISRQQGSGAWDGSVDVTAAAIQALTLVEDLPGVSDALQKAEAYLRGVQGADGGFGNSFSTSWVLQAIAALNQSDGEWEKNGHTPQEYLAVLQEEDGGVEPSSNTIEMRQWATMYAIPAALEKTWDSLLHSFPKQESESEVGSSSRLPAVLGAATSTPPVATTTPAIATTTLTALTTASSTTIVKALSPAPQIETTIAALVATASPATAEVAVEKVASSGGFFSRLWGAIASFFTFLSRLL